MSTLGIILNKDPVGWNSVENHELPHVGRNIFSAHNDFVKCVLPIGGNRIRAAPVGAEVDDPKIGSGGAEDDKHIPFGLLPGSRESHGKPGNAGSDGDEKKQEAGCRQTTDRCPVHFRSDSHVPVRSSHCDGKSHYGNTPERLQGVFSLGDSILIRKKIRDICSHCSESEKTLHRLCNGRMSSPEVPSARLVTIPRFPQKTVQYETDPDLFQQWLNDTDSFHD